jgi:hypothetical protein
MHTYCSQVLSTRDVLQQLSHRTAATVLSSTFNVVVLLP